MSEVCEYLAAIRTVCFGNQGSLSLLVSLLEHTVGTCSKISKKHTILTVKLAVGRALYQDFHCTTTSREVQSVYELMDDHFQASVILQTYLEGL